MATGDSVDHRNWSETAVFRLAKYSRSIARPDQSSEAQPSVSPVARPTAPLEWSHFTQTGLSLIVETVHVDSKQNNRIGTRHQQIILKIIWDNNPSSQNGNLDATGSTDRAGVFLLDKVNLTEVQRTFGHSKQIDESPLKANCKDCVVGLRYATGYSDSSFTFNRIQFKLQTPADSIRFIGIIETICPCKISSGMQNSQSSRSNAYQLPVHLNPPGLGHSFSQPPIEISTSIMESQDFCNQTQLSESSPPSRKIICQPPTNTSSTRVGHSIPPLIAIDTNTIDSQGLGKEVEHLEPVTSAQSDLVTLQSLHPDSQTRTFPALASFESRHTLPEDLNSLSDENLMEYMREIVMEPGFDSFVHRVKRLM
ncbi:hypothetical protein PGT21_032752 [Puccinia graminis f. sp. tritici]|uniref:Uncharacterized protein n=1 Tax=Puccinia graminis f. sp. tritici TaxID=56615 RepID=A0A5B0PZF9_PUCGR|nr:hypothetical protein PGT21_032752 [Puccinia graminis f. sp. tritici]